MENHVDLADILNSDDVKRLTNIDAKIKINRALFRYLGETLSIKIITHLILNIEVAITNNIKAFIFSLIDRIAMKINSISNKSYKMLKLQELKKLIAVAENKLNTRVASVIRQGIDFCYTPIVTVNRVLSSTGLVNFYSHQQKMFTNILDEIMKAIFSQDALSYVLIIHNR